MSRRGKKGIERQVRKLTIGDARVINCAENQCIISNIGTQMQMGTMNVSKRSIPAISIVGKGNLGVTTEFPVKKR